MSVQPISWRKQYVVAVTRSSKTRYFYGESLKDAVAAARLKPGDGFAYAKFERGTVQWAEISPSGTRYIQHGPIRRKVA